MIEEADQIEAIDDQPFSWVKVWMLALWPIPDFYDEFLYGSRANPKLQTALIWLTFYSLFINASILIGWQMFGSINFWQSPVFYITYGLPRWILTMLSGIVIFGVVHLIARTITRSGSYTAVLYAFGAYSMSAGILIIVLGIFELSLKYWYGLELFPSLPITAISIPSWLYTLALGVTATKAAYRLNWFKAILAALPFIVSTSASQLFSMLDLILY